MNVGVEVEITDVGRPRFAGRHALGEVAPVRTRSSAQPLLYRGRTGRSVRELQRALVALGYLSMQALSTGPGVFGPRTEAAVLKFQEAHGLKVSGRVGGPTQREIARALARRDARRRLRADRYALENRTPPSQTQAAHFGGSLPAPATVDVRPFVPVTAPVRSDSDHRSAVLYDEVINQFAVGHNPRYAARDRRTFASTFACDVSAAMGVELPYANSAAALHAWMGAVGAGRGWKRVDAARAMAFANAGRLALAFSPTLGGSGHVAVVRPGERSPQGPKVAQAGMTCFNEGRAAQAFGEETPDYWVHA